jgi:hypothetical protein
MNSGHRRPRVNCHTSKLGQKKEGTKAVWLLPPQSIVLSQRARHPSRRLKKRHPID